ncbi:MAG TPA: ABC transporter ATP-binding protein [Candidatus Limnocylindrales bacterium]|nr:ABC transporter ATP-binding protein [Candidatus Limnocylindrales bacterium]
MEGRQSGLSGSPDIPDPPSDAPTDFRGRLARAAQAVRATAGAVPRVIGLVWAASRVYTIGLAVATILAGILPAITAFVAKLLIDAVVRAISLRANPALQDVVAIGPVRVDVVTAVIILAGAQFVVYALSSFLSTLRNVCQQLLQERVTNTIQLQIMDHASKLDLAFFEDSTSYDLLRRAQQGASSRPLFMVSGVFGLIQTIIAFVSMIALLIALSPLLALVALVAPIPGFIADTRYGWRGYSFARWASPLRRRMDYMTTLVTTDSYAKEVKLFGLGPYFIDRFRQLSNVYQDRQRGLVVSRYFAGFVWSTITTLAGSLTYLYVAFQAIAGRLTLGDLTLYTQAATSVQGSVQGILSGFGSMYENQLYLNDLFDLLKTPLGIDAERATTDGSAAASSSAGPAPGAAGEIVFEHVTFAYPGSGREALHDVSLRIAAGETVAVVGRNGAGKSTLIKLLCRLYDPTDGRILLDGVDLREVAPAAVRRLIGGMFQDYVTYQATAAENIGLGELERIEDRDAVAEAAEKGGADSLLGRLPDGWDTPLGKWFDGGVELSGGEWQKIALGRAFMRDARILVLDEPTSALDAQAEFELFARLRRLAAGRTAIYISHRFSTVRQADRILFLEHGALVEEGTHDELMALGGRYARLFTLQAAAYTGASIDGLGADVGAVGDIGDADPDETEGQAGSGDGRGPGRAAMPSGDPLGPVDRGFQVPTPADRPVG